MSGVRSSTATSVGAPAPMLFAPSSEVAAFMVLAIRNQRQVLARNGAAVPDGVSAVVATLTAGVSQGQGGSSDAPTARGEHVGSAALLLVTYAAAARMLSVSPSTIKRLVAKGDLHPVTLSPGVVRLRVTDLNDYVTALAETR